MRIYEIENKTSSSLLSEKGDIKNAYQNFSKEDLSPLIPYKDIIMSFEPNIFRGMKTTKTAFSFGDGSKMNRQSKNTTNYYTLILDNDPAWAKYPKRSKSFICTTDSSYAESYGSIYHVIPLENQTIGVCPKEDFWDSFKSKIHMYPNSVNLDISKLSELTKIKVSETNFIDFKQSLDAISELLRTNEKIRHKSERLSFNLRSIGLIENEYDIFTTYQKYLNPKNNGFSKVKAANMAKIPEDREVWMSGKVLFIASKYYATIYEYLTSI